MPIVDCTLLALWWGALAPGLCLGAPESRSASGPGAAVPSAQPAPAVEGSDWPIFRGDAALVGVAPGNLPDQPELVWSFESGGAIASSPVVAGGRVFVGSDDGSLYALDAQSGAKLWSFATEDIVEAPPLVAEGRVYVGSHDFFLYALDAESGALAWKRETDDKIVGGANLHRAADGSLRVVVGSYDSTLYCFDARSGEEHWRYTTENYVNGTPAVVGDQIVFGGCDAGLHVVSATSGERVAKVDLGPDSHVAGSAGARDGRVYVGHYGNAFICLDLASREVVWSYPSRQAFFSSPAITEDRVVFGGRDKRLHCAERETGKPLWSFRTRRKVDGSPVICDGRVVFGTADGRLYILGLEDGAELWSYEIGSALLASPAVAQGRLFVGSTDGRLYAFGSPPSGVEEPEPSAAPGPPNQTERGEAPQ